MASSYIGSHWQISDGETFCGSFTIHIEEDSQVEILSIPEISTSYISNNHSIPKPPPLPNKYLINSKNSKIVPDFCMVPKETRDEWDKLFKGGCGADVYITTRDKSYILAHSIILSVASPVLRNFLQQSKVKKGFRHISIPGVPYDAVHVFVRFLYSSCYEEDDLKKYVLHLLVLSHAYLVPSLKRVCILFIEHCWLSKENVIDVLQLARGCDAPRLSLVCIHMVIKDFKTISSTEGWKTMKLANPGLEQELLESVVEADSNFLEHLAPDCNVCLHRRIHPLFSFDSKGNSTVASEEDDTCLSLQHRKQDRLKKLEEKKVYLQLNETMEALLHICREGCRTIGPRDMVSKGSQVACTFPACKGVENLVRHFSSCKTRVPGGCLQCKRLWQLLELHSRICNDPDACKVPLCRHFKEKMQQHGKKDETRWKLLVDKVKAARKPVGSLSDWRSSLCNT